MKREEQAADNAQAKLYEQEVNMQAQVGHSLTLTHPLGCLFGDFDNVLHFTFWRSVCVQLLSLLDYTMSGDVLTAWLEQNMPCLQSPGFIKLSSTVALCLFCNHEMIWIVSGHRKL